MSALGQKQTFALQNAMSALPPESRHTEEQALRPLSRLAFVFGEDNLLQFLDRRPGGARAY